MPHNSNNLIWIDLEMTGLDTMNDVIIEMATIVTDSNLNVLQQGPVFAINQTAEVMNSMDQWNTTQHTHSGLLERVLKSEISEQHAEQETIEFLSEYLLQGESPMCGNSICQDRRFLARIMPNLEKFFHYRNLDVSTIKELAKRWAPSICNGSQKQSNHLALSDIIDSIEELKYYRQHFFQLSK